MFEQELDKEVKVRIQEMEGIKYRLQIQVPAIPHPAGKYLIPHPTNPMLDPRNYVFFLFHKTFQ